MNVSYELGEEEQVAFNSWLIWRGVRNPKARTVFLRTYGIFAVGFGIFLTLWTMSASVVGLGILCIALGLFLGTLPEWSTRLWRRNLTRQLRSPDFQKYLGKRTASVEPTGIRVVGPTGERLLLWDGLTHSETETLDISPADAIVVPRRVFTSDAHRQSFLQAIESAKAGSTTPAETQTQTWWTQSGVSESEAQNVQRNG